MLAQVSALRAAGLQFAAGHRDYRGWLTLYGCAEPPRPMKGWRMLIERLSVVDVRGKEREELIVRMKEGA